jgi:hypothetical protein
MIRCTALNTQLHTRWSHLKNTQGGFRLAAVTGGGHAVYGPATCDRAGFAGVDLVARGGDPRSGIWSAVIVAADVPAGVLDSQNPIVHPSRPSCRRSP